MYRAYDAHQGPKHYFAGVGTKYSFVGAVIGGMTGLGAKRNVRAAYQRLNVEAQGRTDLPTIDVIGFSRGAAIALHFVNVVHLFGLRQARPRWRPNTWRPYRLGLGWIWFRDWKPRASTAPGSAPGSVPIRFLGLWDAVSSFALPVDARAFDLQTMRFGFHLAVPDSVQRCAHAMALDERRKSFRNLRATDADDAAFKNFNKQQTFAWAKNRMTSLLILALVGWPLNWWDRPVVRFVLLGAIGVISGTTSMAGLYDVPMHQRWKGSEVVVFTTTALSTFVLLHVVIEQFGGRSAPWYMLGVMAVIIVVASMVWPAASRIADSGVFLRGFVARSRNVMAADPAMGQAETRGRLKRVEQSLPVRVMYMSLAIFVMAAATVLAIWLHLWRRVVGELRHRAPADTQTAIVHEVWFRGNHTDVGGGGTSDYSDCAFGWMVEQASLTSPSLNLADFAAPAMRFGPNDRPPFSPKLDPVISLMPRVILEGDLLHPSVDPSAGRPECETWRSQWRWRRGGTWNPTASYQPIPLTVLATSPDGYGVLAGSQTLDASGS